MGIHVNGVYVVGLEGNEKGNIIRIYSYGLGYYHYHTIKGENHRCDKFMKDSPFEKSLVYYGCDYPIKLKGNEEEDNMDEKIVVLRNGKTVTATKYADGKKVNSATAKCHPDDKFNFNVGAKIAVGRLIEENDSTDKKTVGKTLGDAKEELKQEVDKLKEKIYFDVTSDFWNKFLNGEIVIQMSKENSFYFFWQFGAIGLFRFYDVFADYEPFMNFVSTLNKNDLVWCKMKDGKLVFRKAHDRSFGLSPTIFIYKYDGKRF